MDRARSNKIQGIAFLAVSMAFAILCVYGVAA